MGDRVAARDWMMENDLSFSGEWRCCETWLRLTSDDPEATCPECETTYTASVNDRGTLNLEPGWSLPGLSPPAACPGCGDVGRKLDASTGWECESDDCRVETYFTADPHRGTKGPETGGRDVD